jgi:hypothetical protein
LCAESCWTQRCKRCGPGGTRNGALSKYWTRYKAQVAVGQPRRLLGTLCAMSDGWTIAGVIASSTSSLIAAGALWIAVVTQRRQQDEKLREQAAKITFNSAPVHGELGQGSFWELRVDNLSDLPIFYVRFLTGSSPDEPPPGALIERYESEKTKVQPECDRLDPGEAMVWVYGAASMGVEHAFLGQPRPRYTNLFFYDALGNMCHRLLDGSLHVSVPRGRRRRFPVVMKRTRDGAS